MTPRRDFLRHLAALPLLAGAATAASACGHVSLIEAESLEYRRLAAIAGDLLQAEDKATDRYVEPERPIYRMMYTPGHWTPGRLPDGRPRLYVDMSDENVDELKMLITATLHPTHGTSNTIADGRTARGKP